MKLIPPGLSFDQALRAGYTGKILCRPYLDWLKTLPCATCGAGAPSDPSHLNSYKGMGTKSPDVGMTIPQCRTCHEALERGQSISNDEFLKLGLFYMIRAFWEGNLVWNRTAKLL